MKHTTALDQAAAQFRRAGIVLALCLGLACSSNSNTTSGQGGGRAGQGGTGSGGGSGGPSGGDSGSTGSGGGNSGGFAGRGSGGSSGSFGGSNSGGFASRSGGSSSASGGGGGASNASGGSAGGSTGRGSGGLSSPGGGSGGTSPDAAAAGADASDAHAQSGTGGAAGGLGGSDGGSSGSSRDVGTVGADASDAYAQGGTGGATEAGSSGFNPCPATGNCKILPLGDSITYGAGADPGDGGGYRDQLFTRAVNDSKHVTFVGSLKSGPTTLDGQTFPQNNEGHIGWTITQVNNIATTAQTVTVSGTSYAGALRDMPNIVLLFIGTNDEGYASSEAGASDRLGTLIDKIVAAVPDALLVVSSIYPFPGCKSTNYTPTQCAANVATYDAAIPGAVQQRAAQGAHVLFVDMSNMPSDGLSSDGVHPNIATGYPWMGDNWYGVIKPYLH